MNIWALLPVRSLADGKSRLAEALDPAARRRLNEDFLRHSLSVLAAAPGAPRTLVVSRCADIRALAADLGFETLAESPGADLNQALRQGADCAMRRGAEGLLVLPCDLPLLAPAHIDLLVRCAEKGAEVTLAGDRRGCGTNALLTVPGGAIAYRFGPGSLQAHAAAAYAAGLRTRILRHEALAFDVDLPEDLRRLQQLRASQAAPAP